MSQRNPRNDGLELVKESVRSAANQQVKVFLPALPHRAEGAVHADADNSLPGGKPQAKTGGFCTLGQGDIFEDFPGDVCVAADGIVSVTLNHQKLAVGGRSGGSWVIHLVVRKVFGQARVDKRDERFLVPGFDDLLGGKGHQHGAFLCRDLERTGCRAGLQLGVSVGEKQPGTSGLLRPEENCIILADPTGRDSLCFEKMQVGNLEHQAANDFRGLVRGLVIYDDDFHDFGLQRQRFEASGDDRFFVSGGHNGADLWRRRGRRRVRVGRFVAHDDFKGRGPVSDPMRMS